MRQLDDLSVKQIANIIMHAIDEDREIHDAETAFGRMEWTEEGSTGQGQVWCDHVVTINRRDHVLIAGYTRTFEWGPSADGLWRPDPQKPFVAVFGYPGFARLERINGLGPTDNARLKLGRALGAVMGGWPARG
jgi:hypothetical protein